MKCCKSNECARRSTSSRVQYLGNNRVLQKAGTQRLLPSSYRYQHMYAAQADRKQIDITYILTLTKHA